MKPASPTTLRSHLVNSKQAIIAILTVMAIVVHLVLRWATNVPETVVQWPLGAAFLFGGVPLVWDLLQKMSRGDFGSDFLAGLSIVTSLLWANISPECWSF